MNARLAGILTGMDGADAAPTAPQRESAARLRKEADELIAQWLELEKSLPKGVAAVRLEPSDGDSDARSGVEIE